MGLLSKIFGTPNDRELKKINPIVEKIEALSDSFAALSDEALRAKTGEFRERYQRGETLDELLPEAFLMWKSKTPGAFALIGTLVGVVLVHV